MSYGLDESFTYAESRWGVPSTPFEAVHTYTESRWGVPSWGADEDLEYHEPYGGEGQYNIQTMNKAWHVPTAQWVYWKTDTPDTTGASYPGPGTFGECTNYRAEYVLYPQA
jgi:hypothetical protein